jgi:EAL domain-containing protein (putative c-di-GMP-specific phosphodiesterase class I)
VKAIDTMAHTLGKETIAECVENLDSVKTLVELGVGYGQGYALGMPAPELATGGGRTFPLPKVKRVTEGG